MRPPFLFLSLVLITTTAIAGEELVSVVTGSADYISQQSDRWVIAAMLVVGLIGFAWLVRYFVTQIARIQDRAEREIANANARTERITAEFTAHLKEENLEMTRIIARHTESLDAYSDVLRANTHIIKGALEILK